MFFRARRLIKILKPDLVVSFGGYLGIPFIICAHFARVPNFIHEQNIRLGRANRFLVRFTDKVIFSFSNSQINNKIKDKALILGLPLRKELKKLDKIEAKRYFGFNPESFIILVMGGSQGSSKINAKIIIKVIFGMTGFIEQKIDNFSCREMGFYQGQLVVYVIGSDDPDYLDVSAGHQIENKMVPLIVSQKVRKIVYPFCR